MSGHSIELALESGPISNTDLKLLGQGLVKSREVV